MAKANLQTQITLPRLKQTKCVSSYLNGDSSTTMENDNHEDSNCSKYL